MKKGIRIPLKAIAGIVLLFLAVFAALQSPALQTWVGNKVVEKVRGNIDADISFKMLSFRPFEAVILDDVAIIDRSPLVEGADTVVWIGSLSAKFSLLGLARGTGAYLSNARLENALLQIVQEPDSLSGSGSRMNLMRIFRVPDKPKSDTDPTWGNLLHAKNLLARNVRVTMYNPGLRQTWDSKGFKGGKINFANLDATVDYLRATRIKMADSKLSLTLDSLTAREKSGYVIKGASAGKIKFRMDRLRLENLDLEDNHSNLHLGCLQLDGRFANYSEFIDSIRISGDIREGSLLSMKSVSFFGPIEESMDFRGKLKGKVSGYVNDLSLKDVCASDQDHNFSLKASGRVMNATDIQNCALDLKLQEARFSLAGLEGFLKSWAPDLNMGLDGFARGESFTFEGTAKGPLNKLDVDGSLNSGIGSAKADITVRNTVDNSRPIIIDGGLSTRDLDAGKIAGTGAIGPITLKTGLSAKIDKESGLDVRIDSLKIDRLHAMGYDYTNISAAGNYAEDAFDGRIIAADPNLSFLFQGRFNLSKKTKNHIYRFHASLGYADLHALNIDKRPQSKVSFQASSNFLKTESHDLLGDINISDLTLVSASGTHNLGSISVKAHANDNVHRIKLNSKFLEGSYVGDRAVFDFINHLRSLVVDRELSALAEAPAPEWDGSTYNLLFTVKGAHDLLDFLAPGTYVANPTVFGLNIDPDGIVRAELKSDRIALGEKFIRNVDLSLSNEKDVLLADVKSSSIQLSNSFKMLGSRISFFANDNHVGLGYRFDNSEIEETKAELILSADLDRDEEGLAVIARVLPSNLYYKGSGWGISSGDIIYYGGDVSVEQLRARHDDELLEVDGGYSTNETDTLSVRMEKFDIGLVNTFTGKIIPVSGYASGNAVVISPGSPLPGIEANIVCDSTLVSGHRMGTLVLGSYWEQEHKRFNLDVRNFLNGQNNIDLDGYFVPDGQTINADIKLDKFNLGYAAPILSTVFSTFEGNLSGSVHASGPISGMGISSRGLKVSDGRIALDFTRALYDMEGDLAVTQDALSLKDLRISDNAGGTGRIKGEVIFNGFQDLATDISVKLDKIKALDLKRGENSTLFGTLPVSGSVDVKGPVSHMVVDVNATTSAPGDLHLLIGGASGERDRNMLVFTEPANDLQQDPYELMMASNAKQKSSASNLIVNLTARATPDATVFIDMGENTLHAKGNGTVGLNMEMAQNSLGLTGNYTLEEGSFRFSAMSLVTRDFTIQSGSSVRFNGPVNETDLSVKGLYVTKASLDNLMTSSAGSEASGGGRRTVNCGIDITGKLKNPELKFSIDVPDLNPSVQMALDNALSTEDKVQKQFLYLLIAGSFLPDEDSGITTTGSDMLFSNVSSIMSGQINNIFEKLGIPLDLGLNYKAQEGRNMFDVAVSTQLFHNRVIVNGAVGNKKLIGSSSSEIAGDIEVEVKLTHNGNLRTTVFSHSADQFSSYLDNSQRNGAGITYQMEFMSFPQLFKEMFMTRQQREEMSAMRLSTGIPQTVIQIDTTGKSTVIQDGKR